jgi:hypothetical protein
MLDYYSTDATPTLLDIPEAELVPFRIRRVEGLTESDATSDYPLEEAYRYWNPCMSFGRRCALGSPSYQTMVCGMDWAEQNSLFIFYDRWRTRDIHEDQFRQARSTASPPPREARGAMRYSEHLPFQVFCCESGTHCR